MKRFFVVSLILVALSFIAIAQTLAIDSMNDHVTDYGLIESYAQTAWPSLHRDSRNSDFSPFVAPVEVRTKWTALNNDAVIAAVTIGPEGNLYATTGQATGSHLHAFNRDGTSLWSTTRVDSLAVGSSPLIDATGDLYIGDANEFLAFHADGSVKWATPIPASFVSAIFTVNGYVGGITVNGEVLLFNRGNGVVVGMLELPAGVPVPVPLTDPPLGLWKGTPSTIDLIDPAIKLDVYESFFGRKFEVANTPAVNPLNNRIYITAAGPSATQPDGGRLYGIDVTPGGSLSIAFSAAMGPGSGTSPAISPDGSQVYASDGQGNLYAFDAFTGGPVVGWPVHIGTNAASPSVAPDGTVYSLGDGKLVALSQSGGPPLYQKNFSSDLAGMIPPVPPPFTETQVPRIARVNSIVSVTPNHLYLTVNLGYQLTLPTRPPFLVPARSLLLVVNPADGSIVPPTVTLRDVTEGVLTMASDGSIYVVYGSIASSIAKNGVIPSIPNTPPLSSLKTFLNNQVLQPIGGISALEPISFLDLAVSGIQEVQELDAAALPKLAAGGVDDVDEAYTLVRRGTVQLGATHNSISDAEVQGEIDSQSAQQGQQRVDTAQTLLDNAKKNIAKARIKPNHGLLNSAQQLIENAEKELEQALSILIGPAAPALTQIGPKVLRFAEGVPLKSELGQNFPNPFNPETWVPYALSQDSNVQMRIYDLRGQLVRTLDLGYQRAGRYTSPEAAAYWDGRNESGEPVSSGVYVYQLVTPTFQQMKRMVILK